MKNPDSRTASTLGDLETLSSNRTWSFRHLVTIWQGTMQDVDASLLSIVPFAVALFSLNPSLAIHYLLLAGH